MLDARLHYSLVPPSRFNHRASFFDVVSQRFLDIDVFACLTGQHRRDGVPVIGCRDQHRVDVFPFQKLPKIFVSNCACSRPLSARLSIRVEDVADGRELDPWNLPH